MNAFVDQVLRGGPPLVRVGAPISTSTHVTAKLDRVTSFKEVSLCYTTNSGPWQKRTWQITPAQIDGTQISAPLPSPRPLVAFFAVQDEGGRHVSSEHVTLSVR